MAKQPKDQFDEQECYISFDPLCDGNCQFNSIRRILREFGFQGSLKALRAKIVSYLEANINDPNGTTLDVYLDVPFSNYLNRVSTHETFGDQITLRVAAELLNIEFFIIFTLDKAAEATIVSQNFSLQGCFYLRHFPENHGLHNIVLDPA